ncbi:UNVERIFIED_CONTAM: hypothetical protein Sangu_1887500 [Sesamum angustifolium]|uniref:Uncharacterized protein n=1 Tax=Sesamum angustifolium TaxID=2727405 RepID=A0AAW2LTJ8_9LAMI
MAANDAVLLRSLELRLLRCSLPSDYPFKPSSADQSSPPGAHLFPHLHHLIDDALVLIESGQFLQALASSPASRSLFANLKLEPSDSAHHFYCETLPQCVSSFLDIDGSADSVELGYKALLVMTVGVAALFAFTQCNITGSVTRVSFTRSFLHVPS